MERAPILGRPSPVAVIGVVGIVAVFLATAVAFVGPWSIVGDEGDALPVSRYARFSDGEASLVRRTNPAGELIEWSSVSVEIVPGLRALGDLPRSFIGSVAEHIAGEGASSSEALEDHDALSRARVGLLSRRVLRADASTVSEIEVRVLDRRGLYLLGFQTIGEQSPTLIDPPLALLPADPRQDAAWSAEGLFGTLPYRWEARVTAVGPLSVDLGQFDDCISVSGTLTLETPAGASPTDLLDQYCVGVGWVHGEAGGSQPSRYDTVSVGGYAPAALPDPAGAGPDPFTPPVDDPASWRLTRVGSALPLASVGAATFSPVYLPTDPPTVLAATEAGGDLVALAAGDLAGNVVWRFPTGGAVYAQPRYDPATDRIYVGASDGVLRALDARGLFLWSSRAGDNIATRPVVSAGTVVFGSEDGHIYGLDADTGGPLWRVPADGAVVSSPAVHGGLVVVADESGVVRALDPLDGTERWSHTAGGPVEAPIGMSDRGVLVADRSGGLTLLDEGGVEVWSADAGNGLALRTEPAVVGDLVVTVDELGEVAATTLADGNVTWRRTGQDHIGSASAAGAGILLAREDGSLDIVGADGSPLSRFDAADASTPSDFTPDSTYGPSPGNGALWMADDRGIVRRLGPAAEGSAGRLEITWIKTIIDPPFAGQQIVTTPLAWGDRLVLSDAQRNLFVVDPATGEATTAGSFGTDGDILLPEAVVVGDTMVVDIRVRLIAFDLRTGEELWSRPLEGQRVHRPVVAGGTVVIVTADGDGAAVVAFDLGDGAEQWRRPTRAHALRSGPVPGDGVVFAGDPVAALDPETGEPRWTSTIGDPAGLPAVVDGQLIVTTYVDGADSGRLAGIDVATGSVLWERETTGDGHGPTSRLVAAGGVAVLTSLAGPVIGIDPATGAELWRQGLPGPTIGNPSAIGDRIWYALQSGQVVALGPADGAIELAFEGLGTSIGAVSLVQRPVAIGGVVVIAAGPAVYAVREARP